jgi:hypothetical protein
MDSSVQIIGRALVICGAAPFRIAWVGESIVMGSDATRIGGRVYMVLAEAFLVRLALRANKALGDLFHRLRVSKDRGAFTTRLPHGEDEFGLRILLVGKPGLDGVDCA